MIYLVIAYRWGDLNGHQYIVHAGLDREAALEAAETEAGDRGGKYGCAVYECTGGDHKIIHYASAYHGESGPTHNYTTDALITIGLAARDWIEDGKAWLPNPEKPGTIKYVEVPEAPPQWLIDRVKKETNMAKFMPDLRSGKIEPKEVHMDFSDGTHNPPKAQDEPKDQA